MSRQMEQIKNKKPGYIDLYYNDLHSLKTTLFEFGRFNKGEKMRRKRYENSSLDLLYSQIYLLNLLLNNINEVEEYLIEVSEIIKMKWFLKLK